MYSKNQVIALVQGLVDHVPWREVGAITKEEFNVTMRRCLNTVKSATATVHEIIDALREIENTIFSLLRRFMTVTAENRCLHEASAAACSLRDALLTEQLGQRGNNVPAEVKQVLRML